MLDLRNARPWQTSDLSQCPTLANVRPSQCPTLVSSLQARRRRPKKTVFGGYFRGTWSGANVNVCRSKVGSEKVGQLSNTHVLARQMPLCAPLLSDLDHEIRSRFEKSREINMPLRGAKQFRPGTLIEFQIVLQGCRHSFTFRGWFIF